MKDINYSIQNTLQENHYIIPKSALIEKRK